MNIFSKLLKEEGKYENSGNSFVVYVVGKPKVGKSSLIIDCDWCIYIEYCFIDQLAMCQVSDQHKTCNFLNQLIYIPVCDYHWFEYMFINLFLCISFYTTMWVLNY